MSQLQLFKNLVKRFTVIHRDGEEMRNYKFFYASAKTILHITYEMLNRKSENCLVIKIELLSSYFCFRFGSF